MEQEEYPVSHKVQIIRKPEKLALPEAVLASATRKIGSIFDGRKPLKGLTHKQEKKYLPDIINRVPEDKNFSEEAERYWSDLELEVPVEGVVIDASLDANGEPVNLEEWVIYQWLKKHRLVAPTKQAATEDSISKFYIFDPLEENKKERKQVRKKKVAFKQLMSIDDNDKIKEHIIRVIDKTDPSNMSQTEIENRLFDYAENSPEEFVSVATDKRLELKALLFVFVDAGIVTKVGNTYMFMDEVIGEGEQEAAMYLEKPKNSRALQQMKAKLKEVKKQIA